MRSQTLQNTHYLPNPGLNLTSCLIYMRQEVKLLYSNLTEGGLFEDFEPHMFQSVEKYLDVVGTWLIVRLKADDPYFQILKKYWS